MAELLKLISFKERIKQRLNELENKTSSEYQILAVKLKKVEEKILNHKNNKIIIKVM